MATPDELEQEATTKEESSAEDAQKLRDAAEARSHEEDYQRDLDEARKTADQAEEDAHKAPDA